jgi:hypothetical protein
MQNFLIAQEYPDKLVPASIMNYATSIYDIFDRVQCEVLDTTVFLHYIHN